MNKLSTCLIIIVSIFYGCRNNGNKVRDSFNADKYTIIAGKIRNRSTYPDIKEIKLTIYDFRGNESVFKSELDSTGEFKFKIYPKTKREIKLFPVEDIIVASPGDSLFILKDFKDVGNTKFSGDRKDLNNLIAKFRGSLLNSYSSGYSLDSQKFKEYCNELKQKNYQKLKDFQKNESVTDEFNDWAIKQIELDYCESLLDFPFQHYSRTKEKIEVEDYYDFLDQLAQYTDNSVVLSKYYSIGMKLAYFQLKLYQEKHREELKTASISAMSYDYLPLIKNSFSFSKNDYLNQLVLYSFVNTSLEANSTSLVDQYSKEINSKITDPFLKSSLEDQYNRVKAFLQNPRPLSASLLGTSGNETKVISLKSEDHENPLKAIIDKFPNKAIYLDFWATWCSPCIHAGFKKT